jgi:predicted aspartyl protease
MSTMGLFRVTAQLTGPTGRSEIIDVLVDTGATFLVVPRDIADRLELRATRTCPLETADGREEIWPKACCSLPTRSLVGSSPLKALSAS